MSKLGKLVTYINGDASGLDKSLRGAQKSVKTFRDKLYTAGAIVSRAIGIAGAAAAQAVNTFAGFEEGLRNVNTIAKLTEPQLTGIGNDLLDMARALGRSPKELTAALYNIVSAGFSASEAVNVLYQSVQAGVAGLASTEDAAKAVTSVINAYGLTAETAADVSDTLFKTVERGVTTFSELSANLGTAVASASAAGVSFGELSAAIATMTKGGINTPEAFTALNASMMKLLESGPELTKFAKQFGHTSSAAMLQTDGLAKTIERIQSATGGNAEALLNMGFNLRSLKAVLSLTRNAGQDFRADVEAIADSTNRSGATMAAFAEQTKTLTFRFNQMKAAFQVFMIEVGRMISSGAGLKQLFGDVTGRIQLMFDSLQNNRGLFEMIINEIVFFAKRTLLAMDWMIDTIAITVAGMFETFKYFFNWLGKAWEAAVGDARRQIRAIQTIIYDPLGIQENMNVSNLFDFFKDPLGKLKRAFADLFQKPNVPEWNFKLKLQYRDALSEFLDLSAQQKASQEEIIDRLSKDPATSFSDLVKEQLEKALGGDTSLPEVGKTKGVFKGFAGADGRGTLQDYQDRIQSRINKSPELQTSKNTEEQVKITRKTLELMQQYFPAFLSTLPGSPGAAFTVLDI